MPLQRSLSAHVLRQPERIGPTLGQVIRTVREEMAGRHSSPNKLLHALLGNLPVSGDRRNLRHALQTVSVRAMPGTSGLPTARDASCAFPTGARSISGE